MIVNRQKHTKTMKRKYKSVHKGWGRGILKDLSRIYLSNKFKKSQNPGKQERMSSFAAKGCGGPLKLAETVLKGCLVEPSLRILFAVLDNLSQESLNYCLHSPIIVPRFRMYLAIACVAILSV